MPGLVITDMGDGDAQVCVVDNALWEQIVRINTEGNASDKAYADIGWLLCCQSDTDRHEGAPDREGHIIRTYYTQTWSVEPVNMLLNLRGILTLPGR